MTCIDEKMGYGPPCARARGGPRARGRSPRRARASLGLSGAEQQARAQSTRRG